MMPLWSKITRKPNLDLWLPFIYFPNTPIHNYFKFSFKTKFLVVVIGMWWMRDLVFCKFIFIFYFSLSLLSFCLYYSNVFIKQKSTNSHFHLEFTSLIEIRYEFVIFGSYHLLEQEKLSYTLVYPTNKQCTYYGTSNFAFWKM